MRFGGFAMNGQFFQPQTEGVPVDEGNDAEGQGGILKREPRQAPGGEGAARSGEGAGEGAIGADVVVDLDREIFAGGAEGEIEGDIDVGERGDVEVFRGAEVKRRFAAS